MKKVYEAPALEMINLHKEEVICASGGYDSSFDSTANGGVLSGNGNSGIVGDLDIWN